MNIERKILYGIAAVGCVLIATWAGLDFGLIGEVYRTLMEGAQ